MKTLISLKSLPLTLLILFSCAVSIPHASGQELSKNVEEVIESGTNYSKLIASVKGFDWQVYSKSKNSIRRISKDTVFLLVSELLGWKDFELPLRSIYELEVKDINRDGLYEMVVLINEACSTCPNTILIVRNQYNSLRVYKFHDEYASLKKDIIDLDDDGIHEVLTKNPLNTQTISGARYLPWIDIYRWDGEKYVKSNRRFPEYYKNVYIAENERAMQKLQSSLRESDIDSVEVADLLLNYQAAISRAEREVLDE